MIAKLKIYASFALALLLSFVGLKHYRDKSKRLQQDIRVNREISKIEREIRKKQQQIKREQEEYIIDDIETAKAGKRDHFERDPFYRMRDKD